MWINKVSPMKAVQGCGFVTISPPRNFKLNTIVYPLLLNFYLLYFNAIVPFQGFYE